MKNSILSVSIKLGVVAALLLSGFVFGISFVKAAADCPVGQTTTKTSPGVGPMPCGLNQCRTDGYLFFTACLSESDCGTAGGTTDAGNKAGCSDVEGVELFCCRISKNRCKASKDPNKLYLCTTKQQCESLGKIDGVGGVCDSAEFNTCCEIPDTAEAPMKIVGEPLLVGTTQDPTSAPKDLFSGSSGSASKVKRAYEHMDNFCHTSTECAKVSGTFEFGQGCPFKGDQPQGYCVAPEAEYELQNPVFGATKIAGLRNMIGLIFNGSIGILIIISALFFIWGSFKYLLSSVAKSIQNSKNIMIDSLVGLALGLGAYAILANVNPNLLTLNPSKIYMINRVSFYHVVYCNDLVDKNVKLMYAGSPDAPLGYSAQLKAEGFNKTIADAKCGSEYFIEGADSLAVCMGQACGTGGGVCTNCSTGLGKDCKSDSTIEHACADCVFGGNVITAITYKPEEVWLYMFCEMSNSGKKEFIAEELADVGIETGDTTKKSTASAGGYVTNLCMKKEDLSSVSKIEAFESECKSKSGKKMGVLMFVFIDNDFKGSAQDIMASIKRTRAQNPYQTLFQRLNALGALPLYLLLDSQTDNSYYFVNKNACNTNLNQTSLSVNESFFSSFNLETVSFDGMLTTFARENEDVYDLLTADAWTFDEIKKIVEKGAVSPCGFSVQ